MNSEEQGRFINGKWIPVLEDPDLQEMREVKVAGGSIFVPILKKSH